MHYLHLFFLSYFPFFRFLLVHTNYSATLMTNNISTHIFDIVEILDLVGQRLSPPDLLNSCQVSRLWNKVLTPWLWETIDDSRHS